MCSFCYLPLIIFTDKELSMSHHHERKEKVCLNCGAEVHGRFCSNCGQENLEPRESAWHIIKHTFEDITHFDGKFFKTVKYTLTRPGFLATEYMNGKRVSHLNPVRMYLFTSAIFFIIISSLSSRVVENPRLAYVRDSIEMNKTKGSRDLGFSSFAIDGEMISILNFPTEFAYNGVHVYDSIQNSYAPADKDRSFERFFFRRLAAAATAYHKNPNEFMDSIFERVFHSFSKVLFLSLPLFALFLQLLYIRQKRYYFTAHAVFALNFYCAVFLFMLAFYVPYYLVGHNKKSSIFFEFAGYLLNIGMLVYLYVAMQRFYKQEWYKTTIKFILQSAFVILLILTLTVSTFLNSMLSLAAGGH